MMRTDTAASMARVKAGAGPNSSQMRNVNVARPKTLGTKMLAAGEAHLVASMGDATGPVPFTSYMTTPDFLRREPDTVLRFTRALYRTQRWLAGHEAGEIAAAVAPGFPDIAPAILEGAVARFARQGTWSADPILRRSGFDYLQDILQSGGFIAKTHRYEDLVDTAIAERAVAEVDGKG